MGSLNSRPEALGPKFAEQPETLGHDTECPQRTSFGVSQRSGGSGLCRGRGRGAPAGRALRLWFLLIAPLNLWALEYEG